MSAILEYNKLIQASEIVASKKIASVYKHLAAKIDGRIDDGFHFDEKKANRPIEFIERFCHLSKGKRGGKLMQLELFQKALIEAIFGFVDDNGERQYREVMLWIARKNGKTTLAAAIALYCLIADAENTPEITSLATKREQAKICWDEAVRMIKKSPELSKYCRNNISEIKCLYNDGTFKPLSSDSKTLDGLNVSCAICDELAAWTNSDLYDLVADSQSARQQPLLLITSTAGFVRENIADAKYKQAEDTINGYSGGDYQDHRFLPVIYELDNQEEYKDPKAWMKANPALGSIKDFVQLSEKVNRAKAGHKDLQDLLTKDFNVQAGGAKAFLSWDDIKSNDTFDIKELVKEETYGIWGVDLSKTTDLSAAVCIFKVASNPDKMYVLHKSFITADALDKNHESRIPYSKWIDRDYLRVCPGNLIDYKMILEWIQEVQEQYGIYPYRICYDRYSATYLVNDLESLYGKDTMIPVAQGSKSLSIPLEQLKQMLESKSLIYSSDVNLQPDACLQWQLANLQVKQDNNGNLKPFKYRYLETRNDAAMALLDAIKGYVDTAEEYSLMIADKN